MQDFLSHVSSVRGIVVVLPITNPIKAHIHSFRSALNDSVSKDANGAFVVKLEQRRSLWMAHLLESGTHGDGIFGVDESGSGFIFLDRRQ